MKYLVTYRTGLRRRVEAEDMVSALMACEDLEGSPAEVQRVVDGVPSRHWADTWTGAYRGWEACECGACR